MVFGTTYCGISHLPINDGDECMLFPLGFSLTSTGLNGDRFDSNAFLFPYQFVAEAIKVTYEGNSNRITYNDNDYTGSELFMLVHLGFYERLISEFNVLFSQDIKGLYNAKPFYPIWKQAISHQDFQLDHKLEEYPVKTPEWILNIYKVERFMYKSGIIPHPTVIVSQDDSPNNLYNKIRSEILKVK